MHTSLKAKIIGILAFTFLFLMVGVLINPPMGQSVERTLRFAHIFSTEEITHKGAVKFAEVVWEKSGGRIKVMVVPAEQLGNERQIMEALQLGGIDMGVVSGNILVGLNPVAGLTSLPYLLRNFDHAYRVEDGPVCKNIESRIWEKDGLRVLGYNNNGFRVFLCRTKLVRSIEDFKGLRVRVPESPMLVATWRYLKANPTPLPWGELYTAMQTKIVDAAEAPPAYMYNSKLFEVAKFCTETNHSFTTASVIIGKKTWESLSEQDRAIFIAAGKEDTALVRKLAVQRDKDTLELVQREMGATVVPIDTKPLQQAVSPIYEDYGKKIEGGMTLIQQIIDTP